MYKGDCAVCIIRCFNTVPLSETEIQSSIIIRKMVIVILNHHRAALLHFKHQQNTASQKNTATFLSATYVQRLTQRMRPVGDR